jgi:hypothetical protein
MKSFLSPRNDEIPKIPKKDDSTRFEDVKLNDTFVPFLNERSGLGKIIKIVRLNL